MREVLFPELFKMRREYKRKLERKHFGQFLNYLKKRGYIQIKNLEQKKGVLLTPHGVERVLAVKTILKSKQKRADGKWQMIIFDIPEQKRWARDAFRFSLHQLGYQKFQESVWVSPYDVAEATEKAILEYELDSYVRTFLIEELSQ
ncbi:MAG: hypothetical protein HYS52_01405 [Candidatus Wildermuthbacteria bacterium]|nr:hypothetical protein [Candidatus Wildermuthbacteria bacterium]